MWFCIITGVNSEFIVHRLLLAKGYDCYCPVTRRTVRHARQEVLKSTPLFSRYIFVKFDLDSGEQQSDIRLTNGVNGIISNNMVPIKIDDWILDEIRVREKAGIF